MHNVVADCLTHSLMKEDHAAAIEKHQQKEGGDVAIHT